MGLSVMPFVWTFVVVNAGHVLVAWRRPQAPRIVTEHLATLGFKPLRTDSTLFERDL